MINLSLHEIVTPLHGALAGGDAAFYGCSTDTRTLPAGALYVALSGERFDGHDFVPQAEARGAAAVLSAKAVTAGVPVLQVADTRQALGRLAALWRARFTLPLVAVTGSNGKTTVKEMLHTIFQQDGGMVLATRGNLNNDIGVPLTLFNLDAGHEYAVVEMGANHSGEIAGLTQMACPDVALITQCAPAHLAGFGSVEGVAQAKGEIFSGLSARGIAVINHDDPFADYWRALVPGRTVFSFALDRPADFKAHAVGMTAEQRQSFSMRTPLGETRVHLRLPGRHNIRNALAAAACAIATGCDLEQTVAGLEAVQSVPGRLNIQHGSRGVCVVDDSYNANPGSFRAAIEVLAGLPAPRCLVMGDMNELGADAAKLHYETGLAARQAGIEALFAVGTLSRHAVEGFGPSARHFTAQAELIAALQADLPDNASVLVKGSRSMRMEQVVKALL